MWVFFHFFFIFGVFDARSGALGAPTTTSFSCFWILFFWLCVCVCEEYSIIIVELKKKRNDPYRADGWSVVVISVLENNEKKRPKLNKKEKRRRENEESTHENTFSFLFSCCCCCCCCCWCNHWPKTVVVEKRGGGNRRMFDSIPLWFDRIPNPIKRNQIVARVRNATVTFILHVFFLYQTKKDWAIVWLAWFRLGRNFFFN